jgi:Protein of unknown function (DUF2605)
MFTPDSSETQLVRTLLQPLLDDFQYWFERSRQLLENNAISFLGEKKQSDLLERIKTAQDEVRTAQMLLNLTDGKVGVETAVLMPWHSLVAECWQIAVKFRLNQTQG